MQDHNLTQFITFENIRLGNDKADLLAVKRWKDYLLSNGKTEQEVAEQIPIFRAAIRYGQLPVLTVYRRIYVTEHQQPQSEKRVYG